MTPDHQSEPQTKEATPVDQPLRQPEPVASAPLATAKPDMSKRAIAAIIDCVAAVLVGLIPIVGGLIATAYWLVRDGLDIEFMPHRSIGKKLVGLQPVTLDGRPVDIETSVKRNLPFAVGGIAQVLLFIPIIGWILMIPVVLVALGLGLMELFLVITSEDGRRMGDKFANTKVIEVAA